jgi:hypothetical protein
MAHLRHAHDTSTARVALEGPAKRAAGAHFDTAFVWNDSGKWRVELTKFISGGGIQLGKATALANTHVREAKAFAKALEAGLNEQALEAKVTVPSPDKVTILGDLDGAFMAIDVDLGFREASPHAEKAIKSVVSDLGIRVRRYPEPGSG